MTGWRIGWAIASPALSLGIRRVHDFLTVGAAAPLQAAAVTALQFGDDYYRDLVADYRERREALLPALRAAGFRASDPAGAYYVMTDIRDLTDEDDVTFAHRLIADPGVAAVPGSSFFSRPRARPDEAPLRVPQEARDARRRGRAPRPAADPGRLTPPAASARRAARQRGQPAAPPGTSREIASAIARRAAAPS